MNQRVKCATNFIFRMTKLTFPVSVDAVFVLSFYRNFEILPRNKESAEKEEGHFTL